MRTALCVALQLSVLLALRAGATTHVVDVNGGHDFVAIGPAVTAAVSGDTILVNPGTYSGPDNQAIDLGAKNLVIRAASGPQDTIIDCGGVGRAFTLMSAVTDSTTIIEGLAITHGWARAAPEDGGGAISCQYAAPVIEGCVFAENEGNYAGAVKLLYCDAIVRSCVFSGNDAEAAGALHTAYGSPTITGCTFVGNTATSSGGAFRAYRGATTFRDCTFAQNSSAFGGCLQFDGLPVTGTVEECILAFSLQGSPVYGTGATTVHSIVFGNAATDSLGGTHHDNYFGDPRFCGLSTQDLTLCANSWGLSANNTWGVDVGSEPQGCPDCASPATIASWGAVKALYR